MAAADGRFNQSYLPCGANVPSHEGTLAPPGDYDWTCFLGPTRVHAQPKRHLDRFSRFCRADYCDRQTDHATRSVTIGRLYVRSTAMRFNNMHITCVAETWVTVQSWVGECQQIWQYLESGCPARCRGAPCRVLRKKLAERLLLANFCSVDF